MDGLEKSLAEIRKEIIETRNFVIRNDNLLKSFGTDLKMVGKKQEAFERKQWLSSALAYLLFAVLASGGAALAAKGFVAKARSDIDALTTKAEEATLAARNAQEELEKAREASRLALAAYQKLEGGSAADREAAVAALQAVDRSKISRLEARALDDRGRAVIQDLANEKYESGKVAFRRQDWRGTVADLGKAMALWPEHPSAPDNAFFLGAAAMETRDFAVAEESLSRFINEAKGRGNKDYAHLLLANAQEALGKRAEAEATIRKGIDRYPASQFLPQMRRRLSALRKTEASAQAQ